MRGEIPVRSDGSIGAVKNNAASKDNPPPGTPGSVNVRQAPTYQRMHSNESRHSDKDFVNEKD